MLSFYFNNTSNNKEAIIRNNMFELKELLTKVEAILELELLAILPPVQIQKGCTEYHTGELRAN